MFFGNSIYDVHGFVYKHRGFFAPVVVRCFFASKHPSIEMLLVAFMAGALPRGDASL